MSPRGYPDAAGRASNDEKAIAGCGTTRAGDQLTEQEGGPANERLAGMRRAMSHSCRNVAPIGCPDCQTRLICFRPSGHEGDCYDAMESVWWRHQRAGEPEPDLVKAPETITLTEGTGNG